MADNSDQRHLQVLVVDDDGLARTGLRELLENAGIYVSAVASGQAALHRIRSFGADVVVIGADIAGMSHIEITRRVAHEAPAMPVLTLGVAADEARVLEALRAGSSGYLLKDAQSEAIVAGVRAVAAGGATFDSRVAKILIAEVRDLPGAADRELRHGPVPLSGRERELLELLPRGLGNVEIGRTLYVSPSTVKSQLSRLFEKIGVENRVQAAAYAVREGIAAGDVPTAA